MSEAGSLKALLCVGLLMCCCYGISGAEPASNVASLNRKGQAVVPGGVYLLGDRVDASVVDLLSYRPLNESGGLLQQAEGSITGPRLVETPRLVITNQAGCCCQPLRCWLEVAESELNRLDDPHECLEIVNRPGTGLAYNRDAERRINQWRAAIAAAIDRRMAKGAFRVALCTEVEKLRAGKLVIEGFENEEGANSVQKAIFSSTGLKVDWGARKRTGVSSLEVPVAGELVLVARFRELWLADSATIPQIDFKLGSEPVQTSIFLEPVQSSVQSVDWPSGRLRGLFFRGRRRAG